jgi:hypothetical protein
MTDTADKVGSVWDQSSSAVANQNQRNENIADAEENAEAERLANEELLKKLQRYIFTTPETFQYPLLVGETNEQPHSIRFFINARSNSRVAESTNKLGVNRQDEDRSFAGPMPNTLETVNSTAENRRTGEQAAISSKGASAVAGFTIGLGAGKKIAGMLGKSSPIGSTIAAAGGGLTGAFIAAAVSNAVIEVVEKVRTLGVIELYVAAPPVAQYSANWENKELGALAGLSDGFSAENLIGEGGLGDLGVRGIIKAAANLPGQFGISGELGASLDLASAKVANPYKEQLFSNMGFRQFAFNYKFTPRNNTEYQQVRRIIDLFKYHMHPEVSPSKLFLEYPSEFKIEYYYKGELNDHLSKISSCALTDIKVTYGNQDAFTTVQGQKGVPAEINMQLAFTELETLTNERIADGY